MKSFTLMLKDSVSLKQIDAVESFIGEDASGSFGIQAGHARFMTCLNFGLARFKTAADPWQYLALPGALLYFSDNTLHLVSRRHFIDVDFHRISQQLQQQLLEEERALLGVRKSLSDLERAMLKRLWQIGQEGSI